MYKFLSCIFLFLFLSICFICKKKPKIYEHFGKEGYKLISYLRKKGKCSGYSQTDIDYKLKTFPGWIDEVCKETYAGIFQVNYHSLNELPICSGETLYDENNKIKCLPSTWDGKSLQTIKDDYLSAKVKAATDSDYLSMCPDGRAFCSLYK